MQKIVWHYLQKNPIEHIFSTEAKSLAEADRICEQYTNIAPNKDKNIFVIQREWLYNFKNYCLKEFEDQNDPIILKLENLRYYI